MSKNEIVETFLRKSARCQVFCGTFLEQYSRDHAWCVKNVYPFFLIFIQTTENIIVYGHQFCLFLSSVLKRFTMFNIYIIYDVLELCQKNVLWCQPRFVLKPKQAQCNDIISTHVLCCNDLMSSMFPYAAPILVLKRKQA